MTDIYPPRIQDGDGEGTVFLDRLPTETDAKKREVSEEERARLAAMRKGILLRRREGVVGGQAS
jgi:hypothetical protein